jgi:hypothetical protein
MVNSPALYLAMMATCTPKQDAISAEDLKRIAGHLLRHQEADGSWSWASAPPKNRPPPFFESDELATTLGYLALAPQLPADPKATSDVRESREKAAAWLAKNKPNDTTQMAGLRMILKRRAGEGDAALRPLVDQFMGRQNKDGGWPQLPGAASDAFATGQALYILNLMGVKNDRPEIRRGVAFLLSQQKDDGSWPMAGRGHPGATPSTNLWPITHLGSAWATIGLMRTVPR